MLWSILPKDINPDLKPLVYLIFTHPLAFHGFTSWKNKLLEIDKTKKNGEIKRIYFPAFLWIFLGKIIVLAPTQYTLF